MRSLWTINITKNGEKKYRKHPTQKPEELFYQAILQNIIINYYVFKFYTINIIRN